MAKVSPGSIAASGAMATVSTSVARSTEVPALDGDASDAAWRRASEAVVHTNRGFGLVGDIVIGIIGALIFAGYGMAAPFIVGAAYAALWEWGYQRWRWRDLFDWRDSLEDSIHVTVGAAVVAALLAGDLRTVWHVLELQAVLLLAGVWRRKA